jgi:hypothetical protein
MVTMCNIQSKSTRQDKNQGTCDPQPGEDSVNRNTCRNDRDVRPQKDELKLKSKTSVITMHTYFTEHMIVVRRETEHRKIIKC